ncbi:MAG: polysaccharide pyruvyl transferase family protein [Pontiella sp.]
MKLVYIADNRCRTNFGCRGTSIALSQLISTEHEIVGTVSGKYTHAGRGRLFFIPGLPKWIYVLLGKLPLWETLKRMWGWTISRNQGVYRAFDFLSDASETNFKNICRCLPANKYLKEFDLRQYDFDGIVINGEGTMIMTNPPRRDTLVYLMFIDWAKSMGKKVYLVNAMFSDCPATGTNKETMETTHKALMKCDAITVRDPVSLSYVKDKFSGIEVNYIPDALFTWKRYVDQIPSIMNGSYVLPFGQETDSEFDQFNFTEPYICVSGSSLAAWDQGAAYTSYKLLVESLKAETRLPVFLIQVCIGDRYLLDVGRDTNTPCLHVEIPILAGAKILSDAALYVSGRFHPSIMASLGGTPCVFLGSNSHKTWSLQEMLEYEDIVEFSASPNESDIVNIVSLAKKKLAGGNVLRNKIERVVERRCKEANRLLDKIV